MRRSLFHIAGALFIASAVGACGGTKPAAPAPQAPQVEAKSPEDSLGPRPIPGPPVAFHPEAPQVFDGPAGSKVWLYERHSLPLVSLAIAVPYGSASEPKDKVGLAYATSDMLDEGAGKRDPIAFAAALDLIGARLSSRATRDSSLVMVDVLAAKLPDALALLSDAVMRPRHTKKDFDRVHSLWENGLRARAQDPNSVAQVVTAASFYGMDNPYGPPTEGTLASAKRISLNDVKAWHKQIWRPDRAIFVVTGDVKKDDCLAMLEKAFSGWKAPKAAPLPVPSPEAPKREGIRTVVVEREDAPQVVMSVASAGVPASDPAYPLLSLVNVALGGSFSSRLNQVLREDYGWTYGARSRFNFQRGEGMFVARAAIRTDAISEALGETLEQIRKMGKDGPTEAELEKAKAQVQSEAVTAYGALHGVVASLAGNAMAGLGPDADAKVLEAQREATLPKLRELSARYLDLESATIVLVGPREATRKALEAHGLPPPEVRDADGNLVGPKQTSQKAESGR